MKRILIFALTLIPNLCSAQILFHDSFDDNSQKWFTGDNSESVFKIDSGKYHIESGGTIEGQELDSIVTKAFFASCSARITNGRPKSSYGFYLGSQDKSGTIDRKIFFLVNPAGLYSCFIQKPDGTFPLARWTPSDFINKGSEWNTISLTGDSARLNLYINDFYLRTFDNPFFAYNTTGVATFDTCIVDFNEIIVFGYPKLEKLFGVDYYNLPEVLSFLIKSQADGFKKIKGKDLASPDKSVKMYSSSMWIPGSKDSFISDATYKSVFTSHSNKDEAIIEFLKLREKLMLAMPGSDFDEGLDDDKLPYAYIGIREEAKLKNPYVEIYIATANDKSGKEVFTIALEIK